MMLTNKAVVCLSGGADSTTALYYARSECAEVHALSVNYGQRHRKELECAKNICNTLKIPHKIVEVDLSAFGGSPLTDDNMNVPDQEEKKQGTTVVPYRNTILATLAAAYARTRGLNRIYMGPTYEDLAEYPDCRPVFFDQLEHLLRLGDKLHDLSISTPFITTTKDRIIRVGLQLGVDYSMTWTCYNGKDYPCMKCDACCERMESFKANSYRDPLISKGDWEKYLKGEI